MHDALEYLDGDPSFPSIDVALSLSVGFEYEKWAAHPEEMDGMAYSVKLATDPQSSFKVNQI